MSCERERADTQVQCVSKKHFEVGRTLTVSTKPYAGPPREAMQPRLDPWLDFEK